MLEPDEVGISASNRNFKGRIGSPAAKAYLASPEVVAASALSGRISSPNKYAQPQDWSGVILGEGDGINEKDRMITAEEALEKIIGQLDNVIDTAQDEIAPEQKAATKEVEILPGFPEKVEGEIVFCDADNINTDGIYPGKYTYQDDVSNEKMAEVCMENYDPSFGSIAREGDILVAGFNFGCGSSREQAATAILAKKMPLVVAGSFGNIFSRNSINNALMNLEVPKLIRRLRETFSEQETSQWSQQGIHEPSRNRDSLDSPPPAPTMTPKSEQLLTRRTGWKLSWDVRSSMVSVQEGDSGPTWNEPVGALPPNVQEIIARGGLEAWVAKEIQASP